ncbi:hypothetical protein GC176_23545 [bacterium]|nr:hypothetical protein [bacterium]
MTRKPALTIVTLLLAAGLAGCSTVEIPRHKSMPQADAKHPAVRCLCLWQQGEGQTATGQSARGFGGQVYFFTAEKEMPVAVEGDVHVFLFDDYGTPDEQARPISEQHFTPFEWKALLHESQFGPVYSFFVPYPRTGDYEANCSIRVRLTRPDGSRLFSELTPVKLVGTPRPDQVVQQQPLDRRREQQWTADVTGENDGSSLRSTTIGVRQDGRFVAALDPSRSTENATKTPAMTGENAATSTSQELDPEQEARIRYYEEKLKSLMKQRVGE